MSTVERFPLFPLGIVALPTELVALHVFEERYKEMVAHCIAEEAEFGIVWAADDGLRDIGCACEISEVTSTGPSGEMDLVVRGTRPFVIEERDDSLPFPAGKVTFLTDREEDPDPEALATAREVYDELVRQATDHDPEELGGLASFEMATSIEFGPDAKQGLLELRSETARLRLLTRLVRAAVKRMSLGELAEARARSNGKVRFPVPD